MEAITLGFVVGVGVTLLAKRGAPRIKKAVEWTARQSGWVAARAATAVEDARQKLRDQYARGRAVDPPVDVPPKAAAPPEPTDGTVKAPDHSTANHTDPKASPSPSEPRDGLANHRPS
jgi:hypothetical protein